MLVSESLSKSGRLKRLPWLSFIKSGVKLGTLLKVMPNTGSFYLEWWTTGNFIHSDCTYCWLHHHLDKYGHCSMAEPLEKGKQSICFNCKELLGRYLEMRQTMGRLARGQAWASMKGTTASYHIVTGFWTITFFFLYLITFWGFPQI